MRAGFDVLLTSVGADFRLFCPQTPKGGVPLVTFASDPQAGLAVVLLGQLFYRQGLLTSLEKPLREEISDAELALAVFRRFGQAGLRWLEGDFCVVVFDREKQRLLALRDPFGSWPLYWTQGDKGVRMGTSLLDLARACDGGTVDRDFLGWFLMNPFAAVEPDAEQTAFRGIFRVRPGVLSAISLDGHARPVFEWEWSGADPALARVPAEAAGEEFLRLFRAAVRERIARGRAAAHLSGGMDSSSVVCVARELLNSGHCPAPLTTLSLVYDLPSLAPERAYIQEVVDGGGPIDPVYLAGETALDFDWFDKPPPQHDEPYAGLFRLPMERLLVRGAHQVGADRILTGAGADELLEGNRLYIADLVCELRLFAAAREARRWARAQNRSPLTVLFEYGLAPAVPSWLRGGLRTALRGGYGTWPNLSLFAIPPWVKRDFAREYYLWHKARTLARQAQGVPLEEAAQRFALRCSVGDWAGQVLAGPLGLHTTHPFLDPRLIRFCLRLPVATREVPGVKKPLLQTALRGILPESICSRRRKRGFNDVFWCGLNRYLPALEEMVRQSSLADLELFDTDRLITAMRQHALGIGEVMAGGRINSSLALVAWYDQARKALRDTGDVPTTCYHVHAAECITTEVRHDCFPVDTDSLRRSA